MRMFGSILPRTITFALLLAACSESKKEVDTKPIVGVLELPFSHRFGASEPVGAARVEIAPGEVRVDGETVITLDAGKVKAEDRAGYVVPKLKDKLSGKSALALNVHAAVPYATLARVVDTANEAGVKTLVFHVRKPGTTTEAGWMSLGMNRFTQSAEQGGFPESELVAFDSFAAHWEDSIDACSVVQNGDCGYRPMAKAQGGKLDMLLRVRGAGLSVRFRQTGAPPKPAEAPKPKAELIEGIKGPKGGAAPAEEAPPEPSTEHVFSLRSDAASASPSPISGIAAPVCAKTSCPAVVDGDPLSMSGTVLSLIGAAFPDGSPEPRLSWVLPEKG
jgi:hypothetical protein